MIYAGNEEQARAVERRLICRWQPAGNTTGAYSGRQCMTIGGTTKRCRRPRWQRLQAATRLADLGCAAQLRPGYDPARELDKGLLETMEILEDRMRTKLLQRSAEEGFLAAYRRYQADEAPGPHRISVSENLEVAWLCDRRMTHDWDSAYGDNADGHQYYRLWDLLRQAGASKATRRGRRVLQKKLRQKGLFVPGKVVVRIPEPVSLRAAKKVLMGAARKRWPGERNKH